MQDLPPILINAISEQRAVLFLGAGASTSATSPTPDKIPQGDRLRDLISNKFLGGTLRQESLSSIAALASNEAGFGEFQRYIRELFDPFEPAPFHLLIPKFRWRALVTTNFDLIIERAYQRVPDRLQNLVKSVKDGDQLDTRMNQETDPVSYFKLHGCIESYTDNSIPLVLGTEQYAAYAKNRQRLYNRFHDLGVEYPVVFVGYSISDPHIQRILFDLTDSEIKRPPFYCVLPTVTDIQQRYWMRHNVVMIGATFKTFLEAVHREVTPARVLRQTTGGGTLSIRRHYRVPNPSEANFLTTYLNEDVLHVHSGLRATAQNPAEFYRGYDRGWGCIVQNLDVPRTVSDSVLVDAILLEEETGRPADLWMLKGPGGNGKSIALKRIAWEAAVTYGKLALFVQGGGAFRIEPLAEIFRLTNERIFLFVDHVALVRNELRTLLLAARRQSIPLSVVGAERDNEWNIYCERLESFLRQEFPVRYLSEREIKQLLELLDRHHALGVLQDLPFDQRVRRFVESAERQLLVALHEVTLGVPFEDIVTDEFRRIEPPEARRMYLDICTLHQFGAPVRAGLISRASGIRFEDFRARFMQPLEKVVHAFKDKHTGDIHYRSRHQHVAEIVFARMLPRPDDKFDLLSRVLGAMNVDYTSDWETFSRLIKGRGIAYFFPDVELGRRFYDRIQKDKIDNAFVSHQRAVFELAHLDGSLEHAKRAADHAFELNQGSRSIRNTQAEIFRRIANDTADELRKRALRRSAYEKLDTSSAFLSEYDAYTRARLSIDELAEIAETVDVSTESRAATALLEAAKETETAIQIGLQTFPDSPQLLSAEADFRDLLDQHEKARQALETAFARNPGQDWLAVRLARKHKRSGRLDSSKHVLNDCLQVNPSSKIVHLELGRLLSATDRRSEALDHLRRSFAEGDSNFEAQFWYARELFLQGHYEASYRQFDKLHEQAPGRFRTQKGAFSVAQERRIVYDCTVVRVEEGYGFLKLAQFPRDIFANRGDTDRVNWDKLRRGDRVKCTIGFSRRGPRATDIQSSDR